MQQASARPGSLGYPVRDVAFDMPWQWLAAGWRDMWRVWPISLGYGLLFSIIAFVLLSGLTRGNSQGLFFAVSAGFVLVGPLCALGLYEASRRLTEGKPVRFSAVVLVRAASPLQLIYLGVVLVTLFLLWLRLGVLVFALFLGNTQIPTFADFVPMLLLNGNGLAMLAVGSMIGGGLAVVAFTLSVVSIPLLMDQKTDFLSAVATSMKTVFMNPKAMLLWAGIIAGLMLLGMATAFVGLIVMYPLVGHASWHAYKAIVVTDGT